MSADPIEPLSVLVIGAGFSGVCAGIKLLEAGSQDFLIVEKSQGIGGTWWENRYPGAACDIPSHLYSFSFEPNPDWTELYSAQPEIQRYIAHCVEKYGLKPKLRLGRHLTSLTWQAEKGLWRADFADGPPIAARFVINGSGGLHKPLWPEIEGRDTFGGKVMHTAGWDTDYSAKGRRIAVIGSAASAVQAVPELARDAAHITIFQRTPNFIASRGNKAYDAAKQARFRRHPWMMRLHRWLIFMRLELTLFPIIKSARFRNRLAGVVMKQITKNVPDAGKQAALTPAYEMGCKRILISDDYYQTLARDNVDLVTDRIDRITEDGVLDQAGVLHEADTIIYATGFDLGGHMRSVEIRGRDGQRLSDAWDDIAEAYQGVMVSGFPNLFTTTGPNTGVGTTSVVFMIEQTVGWILRAMARAGPNGLIEPREAAQRAYNDRIQADLQKTVWASGCHSWYRREDGRIETLYPYNARAFRRQMQRLNTDDLIIAQGPS